MKNIKINKIIYFTIYALSLFVLKIGLFSTTYDLIMWVVDTAFFIILLPYIIGIEKYLISRKQEKNNNAKQKKKHFSFKKILHGIKMYGTRKFISLVLMFLVPVIMFAFLIYIAIKVNYKANMSEFEKIVSNECPLINDNIHNLSNINKILITDSNECGYEIGFIIVSDDDKGVYKAMLDYIKYDITPYVPGGRQYNLFHQEYRTIDSYHYKSIYKYGNNIVYAIAPMDKKNEALKIIRKLGYTSSPSFDTIFS